MGGRRGKNRIAECIPQLIEAFTKTGIAWGGRPLGCEDDDCGAHTARLRVGGHTHGAGPDVFVVVVVATGTQVHPATGQSNRINLLVSSMSWEGNKSVTVLARPPWLPDWC